MANWTVVCLALSATSSTGPLFVSDGWLLNDL